MPTPALIAELKRLHAEMIADDASDDGDGLACDVFCARVSQHFPALIAALEAAEAENVEAVEIMQWALSVGQPKHLTKKIDNWLAKHKEQRT